MNSDEGQYHLITFSLLEKNPQEVNNKLATPPRLEIYQSHLSIDDTKLKTNIHVQTYGCEHLTKV